MVRVYLCIIFWDFRQREKELHYSGGGIAYWYLTHYGDQLHILQHQPNLSYAVLFFARLPALVFFSFTSLISQFCIVPLCNYDI